MNHQEGFFQGVRNTNIYYQCWLPEDPPRAVIVIVHGLNEHSGRYMNLVAHVVPQGYAVYAFDHPGHGKSEGVRAHVERFNDFTDTLDIYTAMVCGWQPENPIFLLGHSLGGLICAVYLLEHQERFTGAILSAPAVNIAGDISPLMIFLGKLLSVVLPAFGLTRQLSDGVSRDPEVVKAYIHDPLVTYPGKVTARLGAEIFNAMQRIRAEAGAIALPILLVQGSADRLVDPAGAQMLYEKAGSPDKTLHVYKGLYHEIMNEPEREQVLEDIATWLATHRVAMRGGT